MKNITLKITGKTILEEPDSEKNEDILEFVTEGKLYSRDGVMLISYPESELSGLAGWTTFLTIRDDNIRLKRSSGESELQTVMEFERGKRINSSYQTPMGPIEMELLTNSIAPFKEDSAGHSKMTIDYSVSLKGLLESHNTLDIEILGENSNV